MDIGSIVILEKQDSLFLRSKSLPDFSCGNIRTKNFFNNVLLCLNQKLKIILQVKNGNKSD
jgi:hypothetical protein